MKTRGSKNFISNIMKRAVQQSIPEIQVSARELDSLAQLCAMSTVPTGEEDPKKLIRSLSDRVIDSIVSHAKKAAQHPIIGKIFQFFQIEWCWRHGFLLEDWKWEWESPLEGKLRYRSSTPIREIPNLLGN